MASLWKHPKSKYWSACFTDLNGRRLKRSTGTTNKRDAQNLAEQFEHAARIKRTEQQARKVLSDLHEQLTGSRLVAVSVEGYFDSWLKRRQGEVSASTVMFYRSVGRSFTSFLGDKKSIPVHEVTQQHVLEFRRTQHESLAVKSVNNKLKVLRMIFSQAKRDGITANDPTEGVAVLKNTGERTRKPFTMEQLKIVLDEAKGSEWDTIIKLGLFTGQRLGDIVNLKWSAVDFQGSEIRFTTRKTGRLVLVPIVQQLRDVLLNLEAGDDPNAPVVPGAYETFQSRQGAGTLSRQFGELLARSGLRTATPHRKGSGPRQKNALTFHSLRHTTVSLLKAAGVPVSIVMDVVGHESAEISQAYTHTDHASKAAALKNLPTL